MARQTIQNSNASLYLDGNAGYFTVPITPDPTGFSFGMWVNTAKKTAFSTSVLASSNSGSFTDGIMLLRNTTVTNKIQFLGYNSTNIMFTVGGVALEKTWVHFAATYLPSGTCKAYINGELVETVTATGSIATGTTSIYFGRRANTAVFAGMNANQLVWHNTTTPWTAEQVLALYQSGTVPTGATAVYPLSEGSGTIAYDTSGNGNNGTITGGTWRRDTPTKTRQLVNNNLVFNGDFEIVPPAATNVATTTGDTWVNGTAAGANMNTDRIFGWALWNHGTSYSAKIDTSVSHSGGASMKLSIGAPSSTVGVRVAISSYTNFNRLMIAVLPNTSYTISCWIKTNYVSGSATTGARFQFVQNTGTSDVTTTTIVTGLKATQDWTRYTATVTTGATTRFATPVLQVIGNDGTGTLVMDAWYDDVEIYPTTPITRTAITAPRQRVDELVYNGDFEYAPAFTAAQTTGYRWLDGTATGAAARNGYGIYFFDKGGTASIKVDTTEQFNGNNSLKVSTLATGSFVSAAVGDGTSIHIPILPSTSYTYSFWMKTNYVSGDATSGPALRLLQRNGAKVGITTTISTNPKATTDWTYYTGTITTNANARFMVVQGVIDGNTSAATLIMDAWYTNISLRLTTPTGRSAA